MTLWFVGFTTDYVAAAWVGNDDSSPTRGVTGGTLPAYIWRDTMLAAEKAFACYNRWTSPDQAARAELLMALRRGMGHQRGRRELWAARRNSRRSRNNPSRAAAAAVCWAGCSAMTKMNQRAAARAVKHPL